MKIVKAGDELGVWSEAITCCDCHTKYVADASDVYQEFFYNEYYDRYGKKYFVNCPRCSHEHSVCIPNHVKKTIAQKPAPTKRIHLGVAARCILGVGFGVFVVFMIFILVM